MMGQFLFEFGTLFAIINPYGLAFVFLNRTLDLTDDERFVIARSVAVYAFCVLVVSFVAGTIILGFFGVSVAALRIAGGLVVISAGWTMLHEERPSGASEARSTKGMAAIRQETFFPLTVPITTGPGTIATAITLAASHDASDGLLLSHGVSVAVAAFIALTIVHAYGRVSRMARFVGQEGTMVIMRLSAFLLLCVGVQIILTGLGEVLPGLLQKP